MICHAAKKIRNELAGHGVRTKRVLFYYYIQLVRQRRPRIVCTFPRWHHEIIASNYNPIWRETKTSARPLRLILNETNERTSGPDVTKFIYTGRKKKFSVSASCLCRFESDKCFILLFRLVLIWNRKQHNLGFQLRLSIKTNK